MIKEHVELEVYRTLRNMRKNCERYDVEYHIHQFAGTHQYDDSTMQTFNDSDVEDMTVLSPETTLVKDQPLPKITVALIKESG